MRQVRDSFRAHGIIFWYSCLVSSKPSITNWVADLFSLSRNTTRCFKNCHIQRIRNTLPSQTELKRPSRHRRLFTTGRLWKHPCNTLSFKPIMPNFRDSLRFTVPCRWGAKRRLNFLLPDNVWCYHLNSGFNLSMNFLKYARMFCLRIPAPL
jgi:hypothetical protein